MAIVVQPWPWTALSSVQPAPSAGMVLATGAVAVVLVLLRPTWSVVRHVVTMAHEGGHAAVAVLVGRRLRGVRLHTDTSGVTVSQGRPTGVGVVLVLLAGYLSPSALGVLAAFALSRGLVTATLWGALALLTLLALQTRNPFGILTVLLTEAALFVLTWRAPLAWQSLAAYLLAWFLLVAGPWPVIELQTQRHRSRSRTSDADQLAALTHVPGILWVALFLGSTTAGLVLGGRWLLAR